MDLRQSTVFKLHRATTLVNRVSDQYLSAHHDLHYAPFLVLLTIRITGPLSQQSIATSLDVSRASVTQRIHQLRERQLVTVRTSSKDARANVVDLTPLGRQLVDGAWQGLEAQLDAVAHGVDDVSLRDQLDRLMANSLGTLENHTAPGVS